MDWLHFVGQSYYDRQDYMKEAFNIGCSRRVPRRLLGSFQWGDRIWLAQGEGTKRKQTEIAPTPAEVFGYFYVQEIGGLKSAAIEQVPISHIIMDSPYVEDRGCGEIYVLALYATTADIREVAQYTSEDDKPLIRGPFYALRFPILLKDIHYFRGYRRISGHQLTRAMNYGESIEIAGELEPYGDPEPVRPEQTTVMEVSDYKLAIPGKKGGDDATA